MDLFDVISNDIKEAMKAKVTTAYLFIWIIIRPSAILIR